MSDFPFLLALIAVPAVGAAVVAALPAERDRLAKQVALAGQLVVLVLAVLATVAFDAGRRPVPVATLVHLDPRLRASASPSASTASRWSCCC